MKTSFTPTEVAQIANISYRQIQYWDKTNFIKPSLRKHGKFRLYSVADLSSLTLARTLRDHEYSIQSLRAIIDDYKGLIPKVRGDFLNATITVTGNILKIYTGQVLGKRSHGEIVYSLRSLEEKINDIFPPASTSLPRSQPADLKSYWEGKVREYTF